MYCCTDSWFFCTLFYSLSVELKLHNTKDIDSLKKKVVDLEEEKYTLDVQLAKLSSEHDHLNGYISAVELEARWKIFHKFCLIFQFEESNDESFRKLNLRYEELEKELRHAKKSQGDAKKQIIKCMAFIRELVGVHNLLLNQINETDNISES